MKNFKYLVAFSFVVLVATSCKKDEVIPNLSKDTIKQDSVEINPIVVEWKEVKRDTIFIEAF